jgi:hypothetical protein
MGVLNEDGETALEVAKRCNEANVEKVMLDCHVIPEANYEKGIVFSLMIFFSYLIVRAINIIPV